MATIVFGVYYFNKKEPKFFKSLVIGYALLEAIRVSLLQTGGIAGIYSFLAKFILYCWLWMPLFYPKGTRRRKAFFWLLQW